MVVDDEPGIRGVLTALLGDEGYEVVTANDGRHALELLANDRPDLLMVDLMMPGLDGGQMLKQMKSELGIEGIPVILMSAAPRLAGAQAPDAFESAVWMSKPFDVDGVLSTIESLIGKGGG